MTYIGKVLQTGRRNINSFDGYTQTITQFFAVAPGQSGSAEAGHRTGFNRIGRQIQALDALGSHQQSKCGIQTAGDPDDHTFAAGMFKPAHQTAYLNIQYILQNAFRICAFGQHRRRIQRGKTEIRRFRQRLHRNLAGHKLRMLRCIIKTRIGTAAGNQRFHIRIGINKGAFAGKPFTPRHDITVNCDHGIPGAHVVGGRFIHPRRCKNIRTAQLAALSFDQFTAQSSLARNFRTAGGIENRRSPRQRQLI